MKVLFDLKKGHKVMIVKFILDSINLGKQIETRELQSNISDEDIKALFPVVFGIEYSPVTCEYEIMKDGDQHDKI